MADKKFDVRIGQITKETDRIASFVLESDSDLPAWSPGAHVKVHLPSGKIRQYSLVSSPAPRSYRIGVLHEANGRGGSSEMHSLKPGDHLEISEPINQCPLVEVDVPILVIAGGIGITPLIPMANALTLRGGDWRLIYCSRTRDQTAFLAEVSALSEDTGRVLFVHDEGVLENGLNVERLLTETSRDTHVYVCGPRGLISAVTSTAAAQGWPAEQVHWEAFTGSEVPASVVPPSEFEIELKKSGITAPVAPDETILSVVRRLGISVESVCEQGYCGTCLTNVLEGVPDHRDDDLLTEEERASNVSGVLTAPSGSVYD